MTTCVVTAARLPWLPPLRAPARQGAPGDLLDNLETGSLENIATSGTRSSTSATSTSRVRRGPERRLRLPPRLAREPDRLPAAAVAHAEGRLAGHPQHPRLAKWKRARFLIASTSEVYGDPSPPAAEDYWACQPDRPARVYDEAKRYAEALTMAYHRQQGVDTAIVRISTPTARMRPHDGRAIPTFLRQRCRTALTVFGGGSQTRSFCYVDDLIRGIVALAGPTSTPGQHRQPGRVHPARTGEDRDRGDRLAFRDRLRGAATDDPQQRRPDIGRARDLLGWEPQVKLDEACVGRSTSPVSSASSARGTDGGFGLLRAGGGLAVPRSPAA